MMFVWWFPPTNTKFFMLINQQTNPTESLESLPTASLVFCTNTVNSVVLNDGDGGHRWPQNRRVLLLKAVGPFVVLQSRNALKAIRH